MRGFVDLGETSKKVKNMKIFSVHLGGQKMRKIFGFSFIIYKGKSQNVSQFLTPQDEQIQFSYFLLFF